MHKDHYDRNQTDNFTMTYNFGYNDNGHSIVTYAELFARQTSPIGRIQILKGGIGLRDIYFAVATFNVTSFNLTSFIYGRN